MKCKDKDVGVKKTEDEEENSKRMNKEGWEKRVFTSIALMSPSTEWRAQSYWKIFKKKNTQKN